MPTKRRVLLHSAYSQRMAGANRSMLELAIALQSSTQFEPIVVFTSPGPAPDMFSAKGVDVDIFDTPSQLNLYGGYWLRANISSKFSLAARQIIPYAHAFSSWLYKKKIDLVHARDSRSLFLVGWSAKWCRLPLVCHVRGDLPPAAWLRAMTGLLPDALVLVHPGLVGQIPRLFRSKSIVIPNSISHASLEGIGDGVSSESLDGNSVVIAVFANVIRAKGFDVLVDALEHLRDSSTRVVALVIGSTEVDPPYFDAVKARVEAANVDFRFVGWVNSPAAYYQVADIVVLPTLSEGLPRTLLEAMLSSKPVVASRTGGIPSLVAHEQTGLLVEPGNSEALASAIARLAGDTSLRARFGLAGRQRVLNAFGTPNMLQAIERLYARLLA